jgi:hypothetical protein
VFQRNILPPFCSSKTLVSIYKFVQHYSSENPHQLIYHRYFSVETEQVLPTSNVSNVCAVDIQFELASGSSHVVINFVKNKCMTVKMMSSVMLYHVVS